MSTTNFRFPDKKRNTLIQRERIRVLLVLLSVPRGNILELLASEHERRDFLPELVAAAHPATDSGYRLARRFAQLMHTI